jgi:hypothetical protein
VLLRWNTKYSTEEGVASASQLHLQAKQLGWVVCQ